MKSKHPKKGAAGRGPGSVRRLADILNQFDLTWDLYMMRTADMLKLMPREFTREFNRFRSLPCLRSYRPA